MNKIPGENPNGGIDWAQVRASNQQNCPLEDPKLTHLCVGRANPFNVKYFELGNEQARTNGEDWYGADPDDYDWYNVDEHYKNAAKNYAQSAIDFARAMKAVDPSIHLTLMGHGVFVGSMAENP